MKNLSERTRYILRFTGFMAVLLIVYFCVTNLFRNTGHTERLNLLAFYDLKEDTADAVMIGASNVYRFYDPMAVWEETGIASSNYAVSALWLTELDCILTDIRKHQHPKLLIVDVRRYLKSVPKGDVPDGLTIYFGSMDHGINRVKGIMSAKKRYEFTWENTLSLLVELIPNHEKFGSFFSREARSLMDNRVGEGYATDPTYNHYDQMVKGGYLIHAGVKDLGEPFRYTEEKQPLPEEQEALLRELIERCKEENQKLLLISTPCLMTKEQAAKQNYIRDIAAEYKINFLDFNLLYDEIGFDFSKDFYNAHHTNYSGAAKMSRYLGVYIQKKYGLEDHRGDPEYADWEEFDPVYRERAEKALKKIEERSAALENPPGS